MAFFGMFKSKEEREMEAQIKFRQGKSRIQRFVAQSRKGAQRYWELAKQAYKLGDAEQFKQLAAGYVKTRDSINRWERYMVKLDALELRRNDVAATGEFMKSIAAMTGSIMQGASPEEIAKMQMDLEKAVHKTEALEQTLDMAMEATGDQITGAGELSDDVLSQITTGMEGGGAVTTGEGEPADLDAKIEAALKQVENQMRRETI